MSNEVHALTAEQVKQLFERGYTYFMFPNGMIQKITKKDVWFNKEEAHKLLKNDSIIGEKNE
jgi:hypothetical protein